LKTISLTVGNTNARPMCSARSSETSKAGSDEQPSMRQP
jgi:hypothetical protein